jgi:NAD(P)-dependent dehydrogenase (short-subunit alcohol dehydrogenase family)
LDVLLEYRDQKLRLLLMNSLSRYDNQGFLVINGTQGIAPDVLLRAAERNATVLFTAMPGYQRDAEQLLAQASAAGLSDRVSFVTSELRDEQAVEQLMDTAMERLPELDVLIHNLEPQAVPQDRPLVDISLDEWNNVLATDLRLPFMLARRAVEEFLFAQVPGRIVFLGYSRRDHESMSASYSTARAGLRALVRCITKEFGRREVACNAVLTTWDDHSLLPATSELVETALFFASRESTFVNGEFLNVNSEPRDRTLLGRDGGG